MVMISIEATRTEHYLHIKRSAHKNFTTNKKIMKDKTAMIHNVIRNLRGLNKLIQKIEKFLLSVVLSLYSKGKI